MLWICFRFRQNKSEKEMLLLNKGELFLRGKSALEILALLIVQVTSSLFELWCMVSSTMLQCFFEMALKHNYRLHKYISIPL